MPWDDILGHDAIRERFRRGLRDGRLASTFLFVGPAGIGKRTFALQLAQALLCGVARDGELEACGECTDCQQVAARAHPDLSLVARPTDKSFIPLELLIGDEEHRMREGLCHEIGLKPFRGGRKVAIIDDADYLNQEGANCLLKTLEEPPPKSVIILIGTSEHRQLPTIRSRSQVIRFQPLSREQVQTLLLRQGLVETESEARELAELSGGSLEQAAECSDPAVREFRARWLAFLADPAREGLAFVKELSSFVDAAGKEAPPRRQRTKQLARWGIDFYRALTARLEGHDCPADRESEKWLTGSGGASWETESAVRCLERCLAVPGQVDANANQATLLECWIDDLATASGGASARR